jgi:hypothetical protein
MVLYVAVLITEEQGTSLSRSFEKELEEELPSQNCSFLLVLVFQAVFLGKGPSYDRRNILKGLEDILRLDGPKAFLLLHLGVGRGVPPPYEPAKSATFIQSR